MSKLTIDGLFEMAKKISEDESMVKDNLILKYSVPEAYHKKLNEELHYRVLKIKEELIYNPVIEIECYGINFEIEIEDED